MKIEIINRTHPKRCNCVLYCRSRVPSLPYGLWTLEDKKKVANSNTPVVGSVMMTSDGVWFTHPYRFRKVFSGHCAVVVEIEGKTITIEEANYKSCTITRRTGTEKELKAVGYYVPAGLNQPAECNLDYKMMYSKEVVKRKDIENKYDDCKKKLEKIKKIIT